jgi:hypothetical protein
MSEKLLKRSLRFTGYCHRDLEVTRPRAVIGDPEGGAQDVRRFSTRQDAASKNPG